ncbi:MAG: response regulator [Syntrophobacteraceae bacterium]
MFSEEIRVLLVDDEKEFLDVLVKRLMKRKLDVTGVGSGSEALLALQERDVDVVILDVKMAGMDGLQTLKEIKRNHPLVEVIMLTGHANMDAAIEGMEAGAFDYLTKPADIDDLLYKVQDARQRKALQEQKIGLIQVGGEARS